MEKSDKKIFAYIAFAIVMLFLVMHLELVIQVVEYVFELLTPLIVGFIIAFVLNVPICGFERKLEKLAEKCRKKPGKKAIHSVSILLTLLLVILIIVVVCVMVIPEIVTTVKSIAQLVEKSWPGFLATLDSYHIDTAWLKEWSENLEWDTMVGKVSGYAGNFIGTFLNAASSTMSVVAFGVTGVILSFYILADRDKLVRQSKKMLYAYTKKDFADKAVYVCNLIQVAYTKFLTGQCLESVILGGLITIFFTIFRLPYALMVGVVTAVCALIPYIGAFISCALGVILAFMISPQKALISLIVYLVVQFVESQFIYPRVVGGSVGLSPLWTLFAVLVGGKLMGLFGMIFFIPLVSVIYILIKEDVNKRLDKNGKRQNG